MQRGSIEEEVRAVAALKGNWIEGQRRKGGPSAESKSGSWVEGFGSEQRRRQRRVAEEAQIGQETVSSEENSAGGEQGNSELMDK